MTTEQVTAENQAAQLAEKIQRYLAVGNKSILRRLLRRQHFADIADVMENRLTQDEAVQMFQYLNLGQAAQVLNSLDEELVKACITSISSETGSRILRLMPTDDAVDILQDMDTDQSRKILEGMPFDTDTRMIQNLLLEKPDSAAGIMSTDFIKVHADVTVGEAMGLVRRAEEKDFIYYVYLVDTEDALVGVVSLKKLIHHDESVPLSRIAEFDPKSILVTFDQELVASLFRKYFNFLAMPVIDPAGVLRGIITLDDVLDVIDEESTEDIYWASGINIEEIDERNLLSGPPIKAFRARFPWLSITMVGQLVAGTIIASYAHTVSSAVIAVSFMPLLTGLSGNMGTQTDTIAVRGLSQGLITDDNFAEKLLREMKVALSTAGVFGLCVAGISFLQYRHWELSLLLACWIVISLCFSAFMGMLLPYSVRKHFNMDPAGVGGPFITTLSDILTFSIYLYVVTLFLERMI